MPFFLPEMIKNNALGYHTRSDAPDCYMNKHILYDLLYILSHQRFQITNIMKHFSNKNHYLILTLIALIFVAAKPEKIFQNSSYEYKQVTVIESVVPGGLGRSRMLVNDPDGNLDEIKLKNFFSLTGINFGNIKKNDNTITAKVSELSQEGWELKDVTSGVYSSTSVSGGDDLGLSANATGIFITRYLFRRPV